MGKKRPDATTSTEGPEYEHRQAIVKAAGPNEEAGATAGLLRRQETRPRQPPQPQHQQQKHQLLSREGHGHRHGPGQTQSQPASQPDGRSVISQSVGPTDDVPVYCTGLGSRAFDRRITALPCKPFSRPRYALRLPSGTGRRKRREPGPARLQARQAEAEAPKAERATQAKAARAAAAAVVAAAARAAGRHAGKHAGQLCARLSDRRAYSEDGRERESGGEERGDGERERKRTHEGRGGEGREREREGRGVLRWRGGRLLGRCEG
ncbi:hypothetical protein MPTK2_3g11340 [Marchantia polymorpha subsp. ruderalis]